MNLSSSKGCSFTCCEEQSFEPPVSPQALMVGDVHPRKSPEQVALAAHRDARQLVRLVQCPQCSQPFSSPVTLPCGHTVCRICLPQFRPRANVSYPNTPDRLTGIVCPLASCDAEHAAAECNVDVTLTKMMELIKLEMSTHQQLAGDTPTVLEEIPRPDEDMPAKEKEFQRGHQEKLHGGRLLATFTMAEMGKLRYSSEVEYNSISPTGHEYQHLDNALLDRLREVVHKELDCLVCYNMMLDPITTACGHTFCRRCLARVIDHGSICPMCRRVLDIPASLQDKRSNILLASLLNGLCPDLVALFVCTLSLPTMPTFLHIFEPRYRLMIRRCLEGNRRFGMVMYNHSSAPQGDLGAAPFLEYGTMLEVVNFELLRDGRSFVETRGVSRFKICQHDMLDGYHVGRVERVEDVSLAEEGDFEQRETTDARVQADLLRHQHPDAQLPPEIVLNMLPTQQLLDSCMNFVREMRNASAPWLSTRIVSVYGQPPDDPALFPYWFATVLPIAEEEKYLLLRTATVRERLKIVYSWIRRIRGQRWPSGSACNIL